MEWLKELLKKSGIEEAKIEGVITEVNKEIPKYLIPKDKYNEISESKKQLEADIKERNGQLEALKTSTGDLETLKSTIAQLQTDNKKKDEDYQKQLKDIQLSNAIKLALVGKVHDEDIVSGLFDKEKLVVDDGKVIGLDEQIGKLKESKAFLFKADGSTNQQQTGFQKVGNVPPAGGQEANSAISAAFGNVIKQ